MKMQTNSEEETSFHANQTDPIRYRRVMPHRRNTHTPTTPLTIAALLHLTPRQLTE
jgi:hypothetical protein